MTGQSTKSIPGIEAAVAGTLGAPAQQTRLLRAGRPLKRWRYVAVFGEELMACAALVQVGPAREAFWALLERPSGRLRERTIVLGRGRHVVLGPGVPAVSSAGGPGRPGTLLISDRGLRLELELEEEPGVIALCPHGRGSVWTRKQAGIPARGRLRLDGGPPREIVARAVVDDTAGHHARRTEWRWSAGVGEAADGAPVAWNLVSGVNDPPRGSERAVWREGVPSEAPPVHFAADLSRIECEDGSALCFSAEAGRSRRERWLIFSSEYRAPFGRFSGTLPGGIELARGLGVVEWHRARW